LAEGQWQPGQVLPSEAQLAQELGVSQGTVRKALDAMALERLVIRQQGRGTFIAEHNEDHILFHFFKLGLDKGAPSFPRSHVIDVTVAKANDRERHRLELGAEQDVIRICRLRSLAGESVIVEDIVLPCSVFPGLADRELPNNLYGHYASRFGVTVGRASERLKAVALDAARANLLKVPVGTPALEIDRVAYDLDTRPVESRHSFCVTEKVHYRSDLR
jgi:GntR family transcriptional regulator